MAEFDRFTKSSECNDLGLVKRKRIPKPLMELGICLHLAELSLSNTVQELEKFGLDRTEKSVHDWVHKAGFEKATDPSPHKIALDESVIMIDGEQFRHDFAPISKPTKSSLPASI